MKSKAQTLQQRLGFLDDDLRNPNHDEMLKWVHANLEKIFYSLYEFNDWSPSQVTKVKNQVKAIVGIDLEKERQKLSSLDYEIKNIETHDIPRFEKEISDLGSIENEKPQSSIAILLNDAAKIEFARLPKVKEDLSKSSKVLEVKKNEREKLAKKISYLENWSDIEGEPPAKNKIRIAESKWEYPITSQIQNEKTGYKSPKNIVGYVDLKVTFVPTRLTVSGIDFDCKQVTGKIQWAQTERLEDYQNSSLLEHVIYVEAKTKIESLGELFRQLNTYKEFTRGDYLVICPDDSNKGIIEEQGFLFYKYSQR